MTSFAFVLGVVPLMIAEGAGAEMRRTLGTAVFVGMLGVTLFGIFLTPVFFYVIRRVSERLAGYMEERPSLVQATGNGHVSLTALADCRQVIVASPVTRAPTVAAVRASYLVSCSLTHLPK